MGDLTQLLTAVTGLITAITGLGGLAYGIVRTLRREPRQAAKSGAQLYAEEIAAAAEDGELTPEEIAAAQRHLNEPKGDRP